MSTVSQIKQKIQPIFDNDAEVAAVFLFGSHARGKSHPQSDIDLAILFEKRLSGYEAYRRRERFFVPINLALGDGIDILDMENANLILLFEILTEGKILIENNREKTRGFMARKILECFDFQIIAKRCAEAMYKKALERTGGKDKRRLQKA